MKTETLSYTFIRLRELLREGDHIKLNISSNTILRKFVFESILVIFIKNQLMIEITKKQ